jgi:hypothetical protein
MKRAELRTSRSGANPNTESLKSTPPPRGDVPARVRRRHDQQRTCLGFQSLGHSGLFRLSRAQSRGASDLGFPISGRRGRLHTRAAAGMGGDV